MPQMDDFFREPDNSDRAEWAGAALDAYAGMTRNDPREQTVEVTGPEDADGRENAEEVMSDLLCDMQHLCARWGIEWPAMLERADGHFAAEHDDEEETDD